MSSLIDALRRKKAVPIEVDPDIPDAIDLIPDPDQPGEPGKVIPVDLSDNAVKVTCSRWSQSVDDDEAMALVLLPGGDPEDPDPLTTSDTVRVGDFVGDLEMRMDLAPLNVAAGDDRAFDLYVLQGSPFSIYVSRVYRFRVDKRPPGGVTVPALRFSQDVIDDGVTSDKLSVDADGNEYLASAVVPYLYKARGDLVQAYIDDVPAGPPVEVVDALEPEEELPFPRAALEDAGNGSHVFTCIITDRAGNMSAVSVPVTLIVRFTDMPGGGDPLPRAKWVEGPASPGLPDQIDYDKAVSGGGTPVRIYAYDNMSPGDLIHIAFQGYDGTKPPPGSQPIPESTYSLDRPVVRTDMDPQPDDTVDPPVEAVFIDILIPTQYLLPIEYGRAHFDYTVSNGHGTGRAEQAWIYVATRR